MIGWHIREFRTIAHLQEQVAALRQVLAEGAATRRPDAELMADCIATARQALADGATPLAVDLLQLLTTRIPDEAQIWAMLGHALNRLQRMEAADAALAKAAQLAPNDPMATLGHAMIRYESGYPAVELFQRAWHNAPKNGQGNLEILRNMALAMMSECQHQAAASLLSDALAGQPDWLDGHRALATLRWTQGNTADFCRSYAQACAAQANNPGLWLAWFRMVAQSRDWLAALEILDRAEKALGGQPAFTVGRLFVAVESGDDARAEALFTQCAQIQGDVINLCRIRHLIRQQRWTEAEAVALPQISTPSANIYWPYLSVIWRMKGDMERAIWLDRPDQSIQHFDLDIDQGELNELAATLRTLHIAQAPYIEQSVRGGTQTDRSVLLRHEPIFQRTRQVLLAAMRDYVAALPGVEEGHPLLGLPIRDLKPEQLLIEGSWSVRLLQQGYNVPHTHPMGWLSSAFYVALPSSTQMGAAPAGHLSLGNAPEELGLSLPPYRTVQPVRGRLAIFPSTMWHGTVPFADGERLVIAFDLKKPRC